MWQAELKIQAEPSVSPAAVKGCGPAGSDLGRDPGPIQEGHRGLGLLQQGLVQEQVMEKSLWGCRSRICSPKMLLFWWCLTGTSQPGCLETPSCEPRVSHPQRLIRPGKQPQRPSVISV